MIYGIHQPFGGAHCWHPLVVPIVGAHCRYPLPAPVVGVRCRGNSVAKLLLADLQNVPIGTFGLIVNLLFKCLIKYELIN